MKRRISVFGATGSIGQNTLDLLRRRKGEFEFVALVGQSNIAQLAKDALEFQPEVVVTGDNAYEADLAAALSGQEIEVQAGPQAVAEAALRPVDWVMSAIVGAAGLVPGLNALKTGATLALANKESLVAAGPLLMQTAKDYGATVLPVDSEHSAVFQALIGEDITTVERVIITASGGAFRNWDLAAMASATPDQACQHPNWDMGPRITIDSASMFNKAMELIETKEFFGLKPSQIEAVIHPESLIHAMVGFQDGALMSHLGPPDMRHAIGFALNHPDRLHLPVDRLDLAQIGSLSFRPIDPQKYPAIPLAYHVMDLGGLSGAAFNAAKEVALDRFLAGEIGFLHMATLVEAVLEELDRMGSLKGEATSLEPILQTDQSARQVAANLKLEWT